MSDSVDVGVGVGFGSVKSGSSSTSHESTSTKNRYYALYSFCPARQSSDETVSVDDSNCDLEDGGLSLSVLATTMSATAETDLRKFLSTRLSVKSKFQEEGHCCSVGLSSSVDNTSISAACYYSVLSLPSDSLGFLHMPGDKLTPSDRMMFIVCFVSFQENSLDLFRSELDAYSQGLLPLLDKELPMVQCSPQNNLAMASDTLPTSTLPHPKVSQLSDAIPSYLECWPWVTLEYLSRTLRYMGDDIHKLIYASLMNAALQISDATPEQEEDIKRFSKCCSLSSLLEQLQAWDLSSMTSSCDSQDLWQLQPVIVAIHFQGEGVLFDNEYSCQFCKSAADKLAAFNVDDVVKIRDFLESVKLAFVHNLNKLKRFLRQAELDFYALYRALSYLRNCGCGQILLRYVKLDAGMDTKAVLSVLENFIRSTNSVLT